jgi:NAD+ diphosphatase
MPSEATWRGSATSTCLRDAEMASFHIDIPALSRGLLDRSEDVRDPDSVAAAWPAAKIIPVDGEGRLPLASTGDRVRLVFHDAARFGGAPPDGAVLLGSVEGTHYWALERDRISAATVTGSPPAASSPRVAPPAPPPETSTGAPVPDITLGTIRTAAALLSEDEAALATTAVALLGWHAAAGFCSRCGAPMTPDSTGHSRSCPSGHQEFPRTDPAVIVLVHDGEGNAVLARQPSWAPGRFSVLAGFAEAGESLEGTVVREIGEEIGVRVRDVEYLGSQPWPFPRSLMIAFAARAPAGAPLRPRPGEIEQARWFSRDRLRALLESGPGIGREGRSVSASPAGVGDEAPAITLPDSVSIARRMVEGFVRAG